MWRTDTHVHCALCVHTPPSPPHCRHVQPAGFPFWRFCCCHCCRCFLFRTITSEATQTQRSNQWCPHVSPPSSLNRKTASSSPPLSWLFFNGRVSDISHSTASDPSLSRLSYSPSRSPSRSYRLLPGRMHGCVRTQESTKKIFPGRDLWKFVSLTGRPWFMVFMANPPVCMSGTKYLKKKKKFTNLPTNVEIFLLLYGDRLYLGPLRIAIHIYWQRCLPFPYLGLLCVWYVHRKSVTTIQPYGARCRNNTERGHNEEKKGGWK